MAAAAEGHALVEEDGKAAFCEVVANHRDPDRSRNNEISTNEEGMVSPMMYRC